MIIFSGGSCCDMELVEMAASDHENEEEKGCCDDGCECISAVQVFTVESEINLSKTHLPPYFKIIDRYTLPYHVEISAGIWQPPKFI